MYDWLDLNCVEISHRVLTEEVERDLVVVFEVNVIASEGAAADGISLVIAFLVTNSQS